MRTGDDRRVGRFIAVEGLDGVGKSTLVAALVVALGADALAMPGVPRPVAHAVFTSFAHDPTSRALFHAACARALGLRAQQRTREGYDVVVDRYWLSSLAYARARGVELDFSGVERTIPAPDVTLWLTVDEAERQRRLEARGATAVDRETMVPAFREAVAAERGRLDRSSAFRPPRCVDLSGLSPTQALTSVLAALQGAGAHLSPTEPSP